VEADVTISRLASGSGEVYDPKFNGQGFYIVAGGASAFYTYSSLSAEIRRKGFNASIKDVTADLGVISIQGPNSREILQPLIDCDLSDEQVPPNSTRLAKFGDVGLRLLRVSFVGELGYELHVPKKDCVAVYRNLMKAGAGQDLRNAGYRSLYSLSSEKGYHLWSFDLRPDDTAVMEEKQGWERPGFFLPTGSKKAVVQPYDWYGSYGHQRIQDSEYEKVLEGDLHYSRFSEYHDLVSGSNFLIYRV